MHAIVGLGNPGRRYERTRHNVGFMVVDTLAQRWRESYRPGKGAYVYARSAGHETLLVKPTTYMNDSGRAVRELCDYYKIELENLMLVYDDLDIPFPTLRLRKQGGAGTHRGMQSVLQHLGDEQFARTRLGIGGGQGNQPAEVFVLKPYSSSEQSQLPEQLDRSADALEFWLKAGIDQTMNRFNMSETGAEKEGNIHE
jgi:PTH1 family peptidyl-tRNA hydrolase